MEDHEDCLNQSPAVGKSNNAHHWRTAVFVHPPEIQSVLETGAQPSEGGALGADQAPPGLDPCDNAGEHR